MRCAASASPYQQVSAFKTKEVVEAYKKLGLSPDDEVGPIGKLKVRFMHASRYELFRSMAFRMMAFSFASMLPIAY